MAHDLEHTDGPVLEAIRDGDVVDWLDANHIDADAFNEVANAAATPLTRSAEATAASRACGSRRWG
jgi:hypothetical protein